MPAKASYLVRGPDGRMATVVAHSIRGALKLYMTQNRRSLGRGDPISVKEREVGDWQDFKVT